MSGRYPGHKPIRLQLASLDLKEQNALLWAISGWLSSLPYLYAWTQPPYRRILAICICRLVIPVPTNPRLPRPEPHALCHLLPFSLWKSTGLLEFKTADWCPWNIIRVTDESFLDTADFTMRMYKLPPNPTHLFSPFGSSPYLGDLHRSHLRRLFCHPRPLRSTTSHLVTRSTC